MSFKLTINFTQIHTVLCGAQHYVGRVVHVAYFFAFESIYYVVSHLATTFFVHFIPKKIGFATILHDAQVLRLRRRFAYNVAVDRAKSGVLIIITLQRVVESLFVFKKRFKEVEDLVR